MSTIANLSSTAAALAPVNIRPHGHRKGVHTDPATDSGSNTAAQVPAATAQNLFGTLLTSLEQVIGVQLTPPTAAKPAAPATPAVPVTTGATVAVLGPTTTAAGTPAASTASAATAASVNKLLQNYLNNVRNLQDGSAAPAAAGTNVRSA